MGVSKQSKRRGVILDEIMRYHRNQLPKVMRNVPLADLRALASVAPPTINFAAALSEPGVSLIAECKKASPSKGLMVPDYDPVSLAHSYVKAGARAISVLTDARHFQGSLEHLRDVKESISSIHAPKVPVLRKDFIFHPYQLYESRVSGADALLLIAAVLSDNELIDLLNQTQALSMNALIEVHTEEELNRVLLLEPTVVGINNRNLQTFEVDFENTGRLRTLIPADIIVVAESGIRSADDVRQLRDIGVDAVLVGESLVKSKDVRQATSLLVGAGRLD